MNNDIKLSYLLVTRNKLPYLKRTLEKLIGSKKINEEILIADGESTDGTCEYLKGLKMSGKIDFFVSEKDFGIAHALNKLMLTAHGELATIITDDDVYYYPGIAECASFMSQNPKIDIVVSEGGFLNGSYRLSENILETVRSLEYEKNYIQWTKDKKPFAFCDLGAIIRRSSLPLLGLHNPAFHAPDAEYSLRTTSGKASIAWYTGYTYVNISTPQSTSLVQMRKIKKAVDKLNKFYLNKNPDNIIVHKLRSLYNKIRSYSRAKPTTKIPQNQNALWLELVAIADSWLQAKNQQKKPRFISEKNI